MVNVLTCFILTVEFHFLLINVAQCYVIKRVKHTLMRMRLMTQCDSVDNFDENHRLNCTAFYLLVVLQCFPALNVDAHLLYQ